MTDEEQVLSFQDDLVDAAIERDEHSHFGRVFDYRKKRRALLATPDFKGIIPDYLRECRNQEQFEDFIHNEFNDWSQGRRFIWNSFKPILELLESRHQTPADSLITKTLVEFGHEAVSAAWQKALDRRTLDPEGAITSARTLLETTCKHVLDDVGISYDEKADLPKLWALCAESLNLAPKQHPQEAFKAILGGCQTIVQFLGTIRNKVSDAHGQGRLPVKPRPRHAELAVNLSGAMTSFLISTLKERK